MAAFLLLDFVRLLRVMPLLLLLLRFVPIVPSERTLLSVLLSVLMTGLVAKYAEPLRRRGGVVAAGVGSGVEFPQGPLVHLVREVD